MSLQKQPRARERDRQDRAADKAWLALCRYVDDRDLMRCRCCSRKVTRTIRVQGNRLERHHVRPRSHGGKDTRENVALLCKNCHDERHVTRELHITGNAEGILTFEKDGKVWTS